VASCDSAVRRRRRRRRSKMKRDHAIGGLLRLRCSEEEEEETQNETFRKNIFLDGLCKKKKKSTHEFDNSMQHKVHGRVLPTLVIIDATPAGSYPPSHIFSRVN